MQRSLVYSHIYSYRLAMNLLYGGRYHQRFVNIFKLIGSRARSVCDLCFGDTVIAEWCASRDIRWMGVDLNPHFCERARKRGFDAREGDIFSLKLPNADVFIMGAALYHFHTRLSDLIDLVFSHSNRFILSEPIQNLSSRNDLIGRWARRSRNPGNGDAEFLYNEQSLLQALDEQKTRKGFDYRVVSVNRDILIDITR